MSLTTLIPDDNSVSDISVLRGMTNLEALSLSGNMITEISALSGLTRLTGLRLYNNSISHIQPLLDNTGLGAGDTVDLRSTSVGCSDVTALGAKGVTVRSSNCPQ
jgi:hypothetical protein